MNKFKDVVADRARKILYADKLIKPNMFKQALKLEVFAVLRQFMEIEQDDISLSIMIDPTGKYKIKLIAETSQIKPVGQIVR